MGRAVMCRRKEHKKGKTYNTTNTLLIRNFSERKRTFVDSDKNWEIIKVWNKLEEMVLRNLFIRNIESKEIK